MRKTMMLLALAGTCCGALGQVEFRSGPVTLPAVANPAGVLTQSNGHRVIAFDGPVTMAERDQLDAQGITLTSYLGDHTWFANVQNVAAVAPMAVSIRSVSSIDQAWKMHPMYLNDTPPQYAEVGVGPEGRIVGAYVMLHADVPVGLQEIAMIENVGGVVRDQLMSNNTMIVEVPYASLATLAADDRVMWIEPPLPIFTENNAENRALTGADIVQAAPYGLDGTGVSAFIFDGGSARSTHNDFNGRMTVIDSDGVSGHATHVAGTVGGSGTVDFSERGMAPNVTLLSAGFQWTGDGFLYSNPGDLESDYANAINNHNADLSNNSIGSNVESNGFNCAWQGDYGVTSNLIDAVVRGSLGRPFMVVWAAGNERQGSRCDVEGYGDYYSVAPPGNAKNHLTVGALNANNDTMTSFSSWGPTDDGRMKPDVSAPGCQSGGDGGVRSAYSTSDTAYATLCGTSMAAPTVTGLSALLIQDFRALHPTADNPRNSTLRALWAHTAEDLGNPGPDYQFGYGSVRVQDAIDFLRTDSFEEEVITQGQAVTYGVVSDGTSPVKVTLCWDDVPGTPNVLPALVNDLDVRLTDPNGGVHYPWNLDPSNPSAPATQDGPDTRNNLEQVYVENPASGSWTIEVIGTNVVDLQPFSIVVSPDLTPPALLVEVVEEVMDEVDPGVGQDYTVRITELAGSLDGDPFLHYRFDGGSFQSVMLSEGAPGEYAANIPGASCGDVPEFYFEARDGDGQSYYNPGPGENAPYTQIVGGIETFYANDLENAGDWTVENGGTLLTGGWDHGVPSTGGTRSDPVNDFDGSGSCWMTGNSTDEDVDGGPTILTSTPIDLDGVAEATLSLAVWYANDDNDDPFTIEITDNGTDWVTAWETVGGGGGWQVVSFNIEDFITPSANVQLRFTATDEPNDSVTEAAIDAIEITALVCEDCGGDWNGDTVLDIFDITAYLADFDAQAPEADINGDEAFDIFDVLDFLDIFSAGC